MDYFAEFILPLVIYLYYFISGKINFNQPETILIVLPIILLFVLALFILIIINIIISPFIYLLFPIAIFENKGAIYSIKEAYKRAKINYLAKIIFLFTIGLVTIIIYGVNEFFQRITFAIINPLLIIGVSGGVGSIISITIFILFILNSIIIGLLVSTLSTLIITLSTIRLYQITLEENKNKKR